MQPTKVDSYKPIRCRVNKTNYKQLNYTIMRKIDLFVSENLEFLLNDGGYNMNDIKLMLSVNISRKDMEGLFTDLIWFNNGTWFSFFDFDNKLIELFNCLSSENIILYKR